MNSILLGYTHLKVDEAFGVAISKCRYCGPCTTDPEKVTCPRCRKEPK